MRFRMYLLALALCLFALTPVQAGVDDGHNRGTLFGLALGMMCCLISVLAGPFVLCYLLNVIFRERPLDDFPEDRP